MPAVESLADRVETLPTTSEVSPEDHIPFVLVVSTGLPLDRAAGLIRLKTKPAALMIPEDELPQYRPIEGVEVPESVAYLLTDIDTGTEFTDVRPEDAPVAITGRERTPLTSSEGIALVTQRPDMLRRNKCFSLLASRRGGQKVPAIWISANAPKLGWCWDRNPHTWLGSASAAFRVAAGEPLASPGSGLPGPPDISPRGCVRTHAGQAQ